MSPFAIAQPQPQPRPQSADVSTGWALLAAAGQADGIKARKAASDLIRLLRPRAYALALRMMGNPSHAEDVLQEAFLRLWRHRPSQKGTATLQTYFHRVVVNEALRALGKNRPQDIQCEWIDELAAADQDFGADGSAVSAQCASLSGDPLEIQVAACTTEEVQAALSQIPERQRAVLLLWAYEDLDVPEISSVMGLQDNAVHQLLYRARSSLRKVLQPEPAKTAQPSVQPDSRKE